MNNATSIFWFRQDLRLEDNPALNRAIENGQVMPIYIFSKNDNIGAASKWWLHHSLKSLNKSLNNHLNFYIGDAHEIILDLIKKHNITSLYWNRRYDPKQIKTDKIIKTYLSDIGVKVNSFNGSLLWEPWEVKKPDNSYYKVYSAFYRKARICEPAYPEKKPTLPNPTSAGNLSVDSVLESSCTLEYIPVLRSEPPSNSLAEAGYTKSLLKKEQ